MKIKIICFGKLDESGFVQVAKEYQTRLTRYCDLEIVEIKEANFSPQKNQEVNTQNLSNQINGLKDYLIYFLDVEGKQVDSLTFATLIGDVKNRQTGKLCFVIGPSVGYDVELKNKYSCVSFGPITMPHQLFRIVLLEQIYRSFTILNHQKYHK